MNLLYIFLSFIISINISLAFDLDTTNKIAINYKEKISTKKKITIAVIDTGIDFNNSFFKDKIKVFNGKLNKSNYGVDYSAGLFNRTPKDVHGHGTHVSAIISAINPNIEILSLKYYNPMLSGAQNFTASLKCMKYAIDMGVDIINYSGGGPMSNREELKLLLEAKEKNILVISAAGNEKSNLDIKGNDYYPASYGLDNIITVGAVNNFGNKITDSNWSSTKVDIMAPGFEIKSLLPNGRIAPMTGTSQATAFVTGAVSLIKGFYNIKDYKKIKDILLSSCSKSKKLENQVRNGCSLNIENIFYNQNRKLATY